MDVLMDANREWSTRPDDQRFGSLRDMYMACWTAADQSRTYDLTQTALTVSADGNRLRLQTPIGPMAFTHWSFGQLCTKIGAPAPWIRSLDPELAAANLNAGLQRTGGLSGDDYQMYYRQGETPKLLALTSQKYGRIYNHEVIQAVMGLNEKSGHNWVSPLSMPKQGEPTRPATADDLKYGTNIQVGDPVSLKRALYASPKDCFLFLVDGDRRIDDGTDQGLARGFFVRNSEVGDATFSITRFLYRYVCMNNIVWGVQDVQTISVKHLGRGARDRAFDKLGSELKTYAEASAQEDEDRIRRAKALILGQNLEDVQDLIYGDKRITAKKNVADAYELATINEAVDGNPNTAWGLAQGLTRLSQRTTYTDERVELDQAAGEVLSLAGAN